MTSIGAFNETVALFLGNPFLIKAVTLFVPSIELALAAAFLFGGRLLVSCARHQSFALGVLFLGFHIFGGGSNGPGCGCFGAPSGSQYERILPIAGSVVLVLFSWFPGLDGNLKGLMKPPADALVAPQPAE